MREAADFIKSRQPVNLIIVAVNIIVFIVISSIGDTENAYFMALHGASFAPFVVEQGEYYRLFTSMFLHFGIEHLFNNMLVLIFLGDMLEKMAGKIRYLLIYLLGGLAGNIVSLCFDLYTQDYTVSAGASGAIFAVIGALACTVLLNKNKISEYSGRRLLLMTILSVFQGLTATGVDNCAHIGGLAAGFLFALVFYRKLRRNSRVLSELR